MLEGLQAQFRDEFLRTARGRLQRAAAALDDLAQNPVLSQEMHALAGEASLIGFRDVAEAARVAEDLARKALRGDQQVIAKCAIAFRKVRRAVKALSAPVASVANKVLLIDDSDLVLEQLAEALRSRGIGAITARSSAEGLAAATAELELIVTDLHLDDLVCAELVEQLRKKAPTAHIAIMSGLAKPELDQEVANAGADEGISKMEGLRAIVELVNSRLEQSTPT